MIRVLVADDEPVARRRVVRFLKQDPEVEVVAECAGGREAVERIVADRPDIVFLDVQMPDVTGIEVAEQVGVEEMPAVVFVTAFDQYAIRAFELNAVDYLLKPFDAERFAQALARARSRLGGGGGERARQKDELRAVVKELLAEHVATAAVEYLDRIAVRVDGSLRIVRAADVDWFETEGNYIRLHVGRANHLIRVTAAELEQQLDPRQFARIHRRYLINLDRVSEVQPWFAGDAVVILKDGTKLRLARSHRAALHARLLGDK
ncbi:MAG: LytTR family DNA-binding domain-containing protein [Gemmatimonadaceae bacterium]